MDLKYLKTFCTIVDEGGFSKAAEKMNYTQSTITFQMGQLEQELSVRLFEKVGRRMVLTKAGEQLVPYVRDVLESVDRMKYFEQDLAECRGEIHIGIGETLLCYRMPDILRKFHNKAPKARLFLQSMNCYDIRDALLEGALDMGVFYEEVGGFGSNLAVYPMGRYPAVLVASPEIKKAYPDFVTPDREIPVPLIINEPTCIFRQMFEAYLRKKSIRLDHTIELWSIPTIKKLVSNNVGISFLPVLAVEEELARGELVEIPIDQADTEISAVCGHHKNKWVSPLMQLFMELCSSEL